MLFLIDEDRGGGRGLRPGPSIRKDAWFWFTSRHRQCVSVSADNSLKSWRFIHTFIHTYIDRNRQLNPRLLTSYPSEAAFISVSHDFFPTTNTCNKLLRPQLTLFNIHDWTICLQSDDSPVCNSFIAHIEKKGAHVKVSGSPSVGEKPVGALLHFFLFYPSLLLYMDWERVETKCHAAQVQRSLFSEFAFFEMIEQFYLLRNPRNASDGKVKKRLLFVVFWSFVRDMMFAMDMNSHWKIGSV